MSDASDFVNLTDEFARIDGLPFEDGPSDWHLNDGFGIELGGEKSETYVFQRADASLEWLGVIIDISPDGWVFEHILHFPNPAGANEYDDVELTIVASADSAEGLDDE